MLLLRHGQSLFNLHFNANGIDPGIEDPELTPLGFAQAQSAARRTSKTPLTRIIVSPFTRALQTAAPSAATHGVPVEVNHEVRERAAYVCDIGSPPAKLAARFPQHDFSHLPTHWWHRGNESNAATIKRASAFRTQIAARKDHTTTLVVSHWAFILALTGVALENGELIDYDPTTQAPKRVDWDS